MTEPIDWGRFNESWLHVLEDLVHFELRDFRGYAEALELSLAEQKQRMIHESAKRTAAMTEEDRQEYYEFASDKFYKLEETFPRILRYSFFVHIYSLLEHTLLRIADDVRQSRKLGLSPGDLKDDGITRAKTYLKKVAGIQFPDSTSEWQDILALNSLRNVIVHSGGYLAEDHHKKDQIEGLMKRWPEISLSNIRQFELSDAFANRAIDTCDRFLSQVFVVCKPLKQA